MNVPSLAHAEPTVMYYHTPPFTGLIYELSVAQANEATTAERQRIGRCGCNLDLGPCTVQRCVYPGQLTERERAR
jgi:hypothetical protein